MILQKRINENIFFFLCFIISKLFNFYILKIGPEDISGLGYHLLNEKLLYNDLLKSLFYMHIQPPLYNLIVGLGLKIVSANLIYLKFFLFFFNLIISFYIIFFIIKIAKIAKLNDKYKFILFFFLLFNPSLIFFENHYGYMHLVNFLVIILAYNIIKYFLNNSPINLNLIFFIILLLTLIFSVFHPIIIIIIYFSIKFLNKSFKKNFFFISIFVFLSFLNPIKNLLIFGYFTNSSFLGFNLSTTLYPAFTNLGFEKFKSDCNMDQYLGGDYNENISTLHQSLGSFESNSNNINNLFKSKECLKKSINLIMNNPKEYFYGRFLAFLASTSKFSFERDVYRIKDHYGIFSIIENLFKDNLKFYKQIILFIFNIFVHFFLFLFLIKKKTFIRKPVFIICLLYLFILIVAHLVNGYEHSRIMYSMFVFHVIFWILFLKYKLKFL
jgi:hypothetical protein